MLLHLSLLKNGPSLNGSESEGDELLLVTELLLVAVVVVVAGKQCEQIASIRCQVPRRPGAQVPATEFIFQCREYQPPLLFVVLRLSALSSPARTAPASSGDITMGVCYVWRSSVCFTQCHFLIDME